LVVLSGGRRAAERARARFSRGTYHRANRPITTPATQVQIHHRSEGGICSRSTSSTTRATAQPAVMTAATSWSLASSGGGAGSRLRVTTSRLAFAVRLTRYGHRVISRGSGIRVGLVTLIPSGFGLAESFAIAYC